MVNIKHHQNQSEYPQQTHYTTEQQHNLSGYPVQAINLANNIQIPTITKQIINIQPAINDHTLSRKPILHGENFNCYDY